MNEIQIKDLQIIKQVEGGIGHDNGFGSFGDFYYTIRHFIELLKKQGNLGPYAIISNLHVKNGSTSGNHFMPIAVRYLQKNPSEEMKEMYLADEIVFSEVVINEYEYLMSREYIKDWLVFEDFLAFLVFDINTKQAVSTPIREHSTISLGW